MKYVLKNRIMSVLLVILLLSSFFLFIKSLSQKFSINFEMKDYPEVGIATLYFDEGDGIKEKSALKSIAEEGIVSFVVPALKYNKIANLRFDPINYTHDVVVERVFFCSGDNEVYSLSGVEFLNEVLTYTGISGFKYSDESGTVLCESNAPVIYSGNEVVEAYNFYHLRYQLTVVFKIIGCVVSACIFLYIIYFYLRESVLETGKIVNNWICTSVKKEYFVILSFGLYLIIRIIIMIRYKGYYFTDEFYFLAEGNPNYFSTYNRAPYIAALVKLFTNLFGNQYYAVKAVPLFFGIVSFACVMYLAYNLYQHSISILLAGILMSFHALFIFNDFYVRMYSFQEMELLILAVILYRVMKSKKKSSKVIWMLFGFVIAYSVNYLTEDISGQIPFISYLCAIMYIIAGERIYAFFKDRKGIKAGLAGAGILLFFLEGFIILIKNKVIIINMDDINSQFIRGIYRLVTEFRIENTAFLIKYLFVNSFFIVVSFILAGIWMIKKGKREVFPIFLLSAIPLSGFVALLYNCRIVRTFIGYVAVMVVVVVLFWDYLMEKKKYALGIVFMCFITIAASPVDLTWNRFSEQLYLYHEIFFCDYEQLMQDTYLYKEEGKQVIALFGGEQVLAYFEFIPDINLCVWDNNQKFNYSNEELIEKLEKIESDEEQYVLIMDKVGADKLHEIEMFYSMLEQNEYKIYNRNIEFNSLYLIVLN